jgi:outer membrane protein assembly factor BamB
MQKPSRIVVLACSALACAGLAAAISAQAQSMEDLLKRSVNEAIDKATQPKAKNKKNKQSSQAADAAQQVTGSVAGAELASGATVPRPIAQAPVSRTPSVLWQTKLGFRDWGDLALANGVIVGSNSSGKGGLFAVDASTGQLRWKLATSNSTGESPASDGTIAVVAWTRGTVLASYSLADGRLAWTKPFEMVPGGVPIVSGDTVIAQGSDGFVYAFDLASGAERRKRQYARLKPDCTAAQPALADGVLYLATGIGHPAGDKNDYFLHAIDVGTGEERWRYNPLSKYPDNYGACLRQIVVVGDTVVATSDEYLYGIDRTTGRQKYRVETREEKSAATFYGLVASGDRVFAVSDHQFWAIEARTGRTAWSLPGEYRRFFPGTAAGDGIVYFQGRVHGVDTGPDDGQGILHAVDPRSGQILWSLKNQTKEPWAFDVPVVGRGALYVATNGTLLKVATQPGLPDRAHQELVE